MAETTPVVIGTKIPAVTRDRFDSFLAKHPLRPSRSQMLRLLVEEFIRRQEESPPACPEPDTQSRAA